MISRDEVDQCKARLMERRGELSQVLDDHFGTKFELIKESVSELSNYDNHPGDHGTELYEREKDIALNDHHEQEWQDINHALEKIENGTYGQCEECGQDIPVERLYALPTATRCIRHSQEQNISTNRPVEEDVIHPSITEMESSVDEEESTVFDPEDAWQRVSSWGTSETPSDFYNTDKNFNDMFFHSGEMIGSAEEIEGFIITDMEGNYDGVNLDHEMYEDYLDQNEVSSILYS
ncbi:TraR/DksA C4-type zinc finger protein [Radiobacillus deserti]|uniref:YteA family sporulation protein n=1 Tax=Radiobacillus deserti TaxID=2594883 RepID=A0A516KCN4_9BACI|nr:TraR/DksA C4-type zinc finger protein [Radiobacillus deserti]QDP39117.1 yteA family sporulation protein [Radiobacillus deserti]